MSAIYMSHCPSDRLEHALDEHVGVDEPQIIQNQSIRNQVATACALSTVEGDRKAREQLQAMQVVE